MQEDSNCYLLDTSVILDDPTNILKISDNNNNGVIISNIVLAELNNKKDDIRSDAGFRAREFFRLADNCDGEPLSFDQMPQCFRKKQKLNTEDKFYKLSLHFSASSYSDEIVPINLYIIFRENYHVSKNFTEPKGLNDAKISEIAKDYELILLTNDISFKIASEVEHVNAQTIKNSSVENFDELEFSFSFPYEDEPILENIQEHKNFEQITFVQEAVSQSTEIYETGIQRHALVLNNALEWQDFDRRFGEHYNANLIRPINLEQKFYYSMITHPLNSITVVSGATGSGKTLMALQAGLELVEDGVVEGIIYARNTVTSSDSASEMGFRKGDQDQKLGYFMYPLYSAVNFTIEHQNKHSIDAKVEYTGNTNSIKRENATETFMVNNNIEVMDIAHIRGTSINKKLVIIDEAQNLTNATMKLIGTRMGEGTKLVIMGDPAQIDHPFLSKRRNALVSLLQKASKTNFISAINLKHTIRSEIANWFDKYF